MWPLVSQALAAASGPTQQQLRKAVQSRVEELLKVMGDGWDMWQDAKHIGKGSVVPNLIHGLTTL